jgi:hypothetical protein
MPEQHGVDLARVLAVFAARMAGGYALCLAFLGPQVRQGSWRSVSLFVIAGLAAVAWGAGAPLLPCAATLAGALLVQRAIAYDLRGLASTLWMAPLGGWLVAATEWPPGLAAFPSAIAIGGTLGAMLLGHSYLTARGLSFAPLKRMAWLLFAVLLLRALSVVPAFLGDLVPMDLVFLGMRAGLGLLLPLVLAWMVIECVRIESNQSATGILYAMTVLVAVFGELVAVYLSLARGIPA